MRLIGLTGRTIQEALARITPKAPSLERAKRTLGVPEDGFLTNPAPPLSLERAGEKGTLVSGAKSLASISVVDNRYDFAPNFVRNSMICWLFFMTIGLKRGNAARRSFFGSKVDCTFISSFPGK